ncbi:hypothetical protein EVAR_10761_1 [Eumeta japonica]|uniref:Uncharacterized protein n=1 Tax=Eumeta variegata TaxID=151549 RepID=A0A4C1W707_EUMVA|nr:hypothetical protein EVAR_10761_1 [Eumeta japonica]
MLINIPYFHEYEFCTVHEINYGDKVVSASPSETRNFKSSVTRVVQLCDIRFVVYTKKRFSSTAVEGVGLLALLRNPSIDLNRAISSYTEEERYFIVVIKLTNRSSSPETWTRDIRFSALNAWFTLSPSEQGSEEGSGQRENVNTILPLLLALLLALPGAPAIVGFSCGSQRTGSVSGSACLHSALSLICRPAFEREGRVVFLFLLWSRSQNLLCINHHH